MRVLNIGSLNYDYVYDVDHIVKGGETIASNGMQVFCGGKGLNQSIALAKAGVAVYHAGLIGEDGDRFIELCSTFGVDTTYLQKMNGKSGHTIIQVDANGQNSIILFGGTNQMLTKEYIDEVLSNFTCGDILLLQNEVNELAYIIEQGYRIGLQIILNPSPMNSKLMECDLSKVSVFMINEIEGEQLTKETEPDRILSSLRNQFPNAKVVLTLGAKGVMYQDHEVTIYQESMKVKVTDTTAAGDTFTGYFIAGMLEGLPMEDVLLLCTKACGITVTRKGAAASIPLRQEVQIN